MQKLNSLTSRRGRSETYSFPKAPPHDERSKNQLTGDKTLNCPSSWRRYSWIYRLPCKSCIEFLDCSFLELPPVLGGLFNDTVTLSQCTYVTHPQYCLNKFQWAHCVAMLTFAVSFLWTIVGAPSGMKCLFTSLQEKLAKQPSHT